MAKEIGRLHSVGLGMEATPGTADTIDIWLPFEEVNFKPMATIVKDPSGIGTITSDNDAHMTKMWTEIEGKAILRPTSIGWLLLGTMGTAAAPTLLETGVYKHSFTLLNTNAHKSYTVIHDDQTQEERALYCMIDELGISGAVGEYARLELKMKGRKTADTTGNSPSFLSTGENPFMVSRLGVKFATNIAGIGAASVVPVQNMKMTISKNLEQIFSTASDNTVDATDFATQHNQNFEIKGDFEMVYDSKVYRDAYLAGTKQAIQFLFQGRALIGATKYETIDIQLASTVLEDWGRSTDANGIVTQSFGFTALYKLSEALMLTIDIQNAKSSQYA